MPSPIPVTVVTSASDARGMHLVKQLHQGSKDLRIQALVPPSSKRRKSRSRTLIQTTPRLRKLGQGCACCTVRGDVLSKIQRIARDASADHIMVHARWRDNLVTLAKTFTVADEKGDVLSDVAFLQSLVVLCKPEELLSTMTSGSGSWVDRIQMADVLVLDVEEDTDKNVVREAERVLAALNPYACVKRTHDRGLQVDELAVERPFDLQEAQRRTKLLDLFNDEVVEGKEASSRFTFNARRPFHPERLARFLGNISTRVLRIRGVFWVTTRPESIATLDVTGGKVILSDGGPWWAAVPEKEHPSSPDFQRFLKSVWDPDFGDRQQQIAIIGLDLEPEKVLAELDQCLVTGQELVDSSEWPSMPDPFDWPSS